MICPDCKTNLKAVRSPGGALWQCKNCSGIAANLAVLKKYLEPDTIKEFWRKSNLFFQISNRSCPSCSQPLKEFPSHIDKNTVKLDICRTCQCIWFDYGELKKFPKKQIEDYQLPPEIKKQFAIYKITSENQLNAKIEHDVQKLDEWTNTSFMVIKILARLFLRI